MKVNHLNSTEVYKAYSANAPEQANPRNDVVRRSQSSVTGLQDKVNISSKVLQMKEIDQAVEAVPDVRADKVAELEQKLKNGTYQADYGTIADKLLSPDLSARF
jgi:negative regulator of flagellin synthesis FlgM